MDGGKLGNKRALLKPWRPQTGAADDDEAEPEDDDIDVVSSSFKVRSVTVMKTEASVRARRARAVARGAASIPQCETMHIGGVELGLPEVAWGHGFDGTSTGTAISGVVLDEVENDWKENVRTKKGIYGSHRHAVGNVVADQPTTKQPRADSDIEPLFFSTLPRAFYQSIITGYSVKVVLDMTPGAGRMAEAALLARCGHQKVAYFGLCMSEQHMNGLRERLEMFVLGEMKRKESPLWMPRFACAVEGNNADGGSGSGSKEKEGGKEKERKEKEGGSKEKKGGKEKEEKEDKAGPSKEDRKRKKALPPKAAKTAKKAASSSKAEDPEEDGGESAWDLSSSGDDE